MRSSPQRPAAKFALAAACLLISTMAHAAGAQPKPPSLDWPNKPNSAKSGSFAVTQFATDDPDRFIAEWRKPAHTVRVNVTTQIRRNQPITTFINFLGCRADKAGKCNVTATFTLRGPDGKIKRIPAMDVWANQPQPPRGFIHLSRDGLRTTFDASDPVGTYTLRAAVTDHVAGITLHTQQDITVSN